MAQKQRNIEFGVPSQSSIFCWSDLTPDQYKSIEGVTDIYASPSEDKSIVVYFDPRYDIEDIKAELEALADKLTDDDAVLVNFTEHARESWPGPCGDEVEL